MSVSASSANNNNPYPTLERWMQVMDNICKHEKKAITKPLELSEDLFNKFHNVFLQNWIIFRGLDYSGKLAMRDIVMDHGSHLLIKTFDVRFSIPTVKAWLEVIEEINTIGKKLVSYPT